MLFEDISRFWRNYGEAAQSQGIFSWETAGVILDLLTEFSLSQNSETFMNLYNKVALGEDPAEKFTALPVIPVSADDTSSYIAWDDYAAAYKYLGENK